MSLKGRFYACDMLYGSKCWAMGKKIEQRMSVAEMKMLRWMNGITTREYIYMRRSVGVASIR